MLVLFGLLILATRLPLAPGQLFTFDDVNLAYSIGHYDIRISQPHPPGYPLFVMEMRLLGWLHVKRAESILLFLALAGSIAALLMAVHCGNRIFGGDSGLWAALILWLAPPFWHAGVTSALRVQLAVISLVVGACCWKAWRGEAAWVRWSAIALAAGAGIRPETGVLLFPLWAASALRARVNWAERARALGWMAATVLVWLAPAMAASGGPLTFVRANLDYISDQASVTSGLFGAADSTWLRTFYRLLAWVFCGTVGLVPAGLLAWRGREGWKVGGERWVFLGLWLLPAFAFALNVHVEDPGQTLMMVAVVALLGGYLIERALDSLGAYVSRWLVASLLAACCVLAAVWAHPNDVLHMGWTELAAVGIALPVKLAPVKNRGWVPRWQAALLVVAPMLYINYTCFQHRGWYYRGSATGGLAGAAEHAWADINSGFALTSLEQIQSTLAVDDHSLREVRRLIAERPGRTVVVWERGLTAWRKVGYYAPDVRMYVLEHKRISGGAPPVIAVWQGAKLLERQEGPGPLRLTLPREARIVWMLNPGTEFAGLVSRSFAAAADGPVSYTDLPAEAGVRNLGEYQVAW